LNEIGRMTWQEIDFDRKLWTLPAERAKNGRALTLPLSNQALTILEAQPRGESDFVFAIDGTPVANWSRIKQRLDELAGLPPFVIHDLRRSVVTGLARIGVDLPVIERIVNHASGSFRGIVSTYQKYSFEPEMRKALDHWGLYVENLPARTIIARPVEAADTRQLEAAE
jgi:integrase